jgi:putative membrane protein
MIVRDRPHGLQLLVTLRGSVLPRIAGELATCTTLSLVVTLSHGFLYHWKITLTTVPFTLIGLALAIFLGFRNSAAYDRYWEARRLWGDLVHRSRSFARQVQTLPALDAAADAGDADGPRHALMMRTIALAHALRHQLRGTNGREDMGRLLGLDEATALAASARGTEFLLLRMGRGVGEFVRAGVLHPALAANADESLSAMSAIAAGCERIRQTPIPFAYTLLLHRTAWLYCFFLPFGLVDTVGYMTPLVVAIVAYTFFGLAALGEEIEEPFGLADNHLPLEALCREIEVSVLAAMGVQDLPPRLEPVNSVLR